MPATLAQIAAAHAHRAAYMFKIAAAVKAAWTASMLTLEKGGISILDERYQEAPARKANAAPSI